MNVVMKKLIVITKEVMVVINYNVTVNETIIYRKVTMKL